MKKFTLCGITIFLALLCGVTVQAQKVDFRASGFIDAASMLAVNVPYAYDVPGYTPYYAWFPPIYGPHPLLNIGTEGFGHALDKTRSLMQTRFRLKLDAAVGNQVSGTLFLEGDAGEWGSRDQGRNNLGRWAGDQAAVEIKNAYLDFAVPVIPVPATVRVGLQAFAVRPQVLVYNDGTGVTAAIKIDPLIIEPMWYKAQENLDYAADDMDIYGVNVSANISRTKVGGYGLYYNMNTYPFIAANTSIVNFKSKMWWLGVYADGKFGPFDTNFDFVVDTGDVEDHRAIAVRSPDVKYRGWAGRLKIDYPWDQFTFGLLGVYGSGSDLKKTDGGVGSLGGLPGNTTPYGTPTRKVSGYMVPPASEQFGSAGMSLILDGFPVWSGFLGYNALNYTQMHRGSIGGIWVAKLYTSYKATEWYKITLAGLYIGDTTKNGNTMGNARRATGFPRDDKTIGVEFDLIHEIKIYKNLKYDIGFGYLFAGKALEYFNIETGRNKDGKDPWALITRLTYTF
jgi:hypothetical protein